MIQDSSIYPYSTVGLLVTQTLEGRQHVCAATLVGRRHIISCSHCATWSNFRDDSPPAAPLLFYPRYNQEANVKVSNVIYTYWLRKLDGVRYYPDDYSGDWLVGVLDRYMDTTNGI